MTPGSSSPLQAPRPPAGCTSPASLCKALFLLLSLFAVFAGFRDVLRGDIINFSASEMTGGRPSTGRDDNDAKSASDRVNYDHYQPTEIFSKYDETTSSSYFVFLQKFPLESTFRALDDRSTYEIDWDTLYYDSSKPLVVDVGSGMNGRLY